jgi:hypothetical protein
MQLLLGFKGLSKPRSFLPDKPVRRLITPKLGGVRTLLGGNLRGFPALLEANFVVQV